MLKKSKLIHLGRTQANDARCFRRGSKENKSAKRHTSRIIRQFLKKELKNEFEY
jgi:hypothetical protein